MRIIDYNKNSNMGPHGGHWTGRPEDQYSDEPGTATYEEACQIVDYMVKDMLTNGFIDKSMVINPDSDFEIRKSFSVYKDGRIESGNRDNGVGCYMCFPVKIDKSALENIILAATENKTFGVKQYNCNDGPSQICFHTTYNKLLQYMNNQLNKDNSAKSI